MSDNSFKNIIPIFKHVAISEWALWWSGDEFKRLKRFSNLLSEIVYSFTVLTIIFKIYQKL